MNIAPRFAKGFGRVLCGLALSGAVLSGVAWANGEEFFEPGNEPPILYYYGHIKDTNNKVLSNVVVVIKAKNVGMSFPVRSDAPGHFRSPDIGKAIQGLGKEVDPAQMEIVATKAGYRQVQPSTPAAPNMFQGGVLVDFRLEPVPAAPAKKK